MCEQGEREGGRERGIEGVPTEALGVKNSGAIGVEEGEEESAEGGVEGGREEEEGVKQSRHHQGECIGREATLCGGGREGGGEGGRKGGR
jgi:hypothetical protein